MAYLFLSIFSSVLVAVVIRLNEGRNLNRFGVMFFNYCTASLLGYLLMQKPLIFENSGKLIALSFSTGFFFVSAFIVYMTSVRRLGLAIPVTVTRLSVVIPVLGSIFIFSEAVNGFQAAGLLLALIAIYLFSVRKNTVVEKIDKLEILLPGLLFLLIGSADFSLKIFQENFPQALRLNFVFLVFAVASLYTFLLVLLKRVRITGETVLGGILLGIPNFFSAYFMLLVLQAFPGAIAFPLNNIGIIALSTFTGFLFWKERLHSRAVAALCLAIVAVVLLNI